MQGLWSNHRRSKLNLNSPGISPAATPVVEDATLVTPPHLEDPSENPSLQDGVTLDAQSSSGKRKLRSSRVVDSSSKRTKISSTTGSSISKEFAPPFARLSDLGGVDECVEKMLELVAMPLCHPEIYLHTGVQPPRGVLLHGPPGCGKTLLANAMAGVMSCVTALGNISD
jgi:ribosome biogenesis ATPase